MGIFNRRNRAPAKLPSHIAIIMDGNGRWAKVRGLPGAPGIRQAPRDFARFPNTAAR